MKVIKVVKKSQQDMEKEIDKGKDNYTVRNMFIDLTKWDVFLSKINGKTS